MLKVKMLKTGAIEEVTPNVAHGLIERGEAKPYKELKKREEPDQQYKTTAMGANKRFNKNKSL